MDKNYKDIHVVTNYDEYVIRQVTDVIVKSSGKFMKIEYLVGENFNPKTMLVCPPIRQTMLVPCIQGLKIYID